MENKDKKMTDVYKEIMEKDLKDFPSEKAKMDFLLKLTRLLIW